ncbi:MAG: serine/threonine specific protein phosphatase protein [Proteobacteria bacterium]|nr:serine/threonine specific protein phosphatase protein [Pseudomonadota bacterium]
MLTAVRSLLGFGTKSEPAPSVDRRERVEIDPRDTVIYAIGDVHGCYAELKAAEQQVFADAANTPAERRIILYLGDLVDRGPQSADVLDHLAGAPPPSFERLSLCGNHDEAFLSFLDDPHANMGWLDFGGEQTLDSYGIDLTRLSRHRGGLGGLGEIVRATVPEAHVSLLRRLPVSVRFGDVLFVHAGVRPGVPLAAQNDDDFMWIREPFVSEPNGLGITVVHGHTPANEPVFAPGRIGIDTGAFATGRLTVLRVFGDRATLLA